MQTNQVLAFELMILEVGYASIKLPRLVLDDETVVVYCLNLIISDCFAKFDYNKDFYQIEITIS